MTSTASGILITKADGTLEPFDPAKLRASLKRSGAPDEDAESVRRETEAFLFPGMTTREIYRRAYDALKRRSRRSAARYRLKEAIFRLGPTGYPFERFIGELLRHQGYRVQVGMTLDGRCVTHEVDVLAESDHRRFMIECKFHSSARGKCDVKVPLYVHSRFGDLKARWESGDDGNRTLLQCWIITNTRFTTDAIQYARCAGLFLIGWDFPERSGLKDRIDSSGLHPLTCLTKLTRAEKQRLLDGGIVLCRDVLRNERLIGEAGVPERRRSAVLEELRGLCG